MKSLRVVIYATAIATFSISTGLKTVRADAVIDRLSLGYRSVSQITDDPKAPAPCLLTAKYGFNDLKGFSSYIGTGLAYTLQPESKAGENVKINAGIGGQAGFSYLLGENSLLNIDYNYLHLSPDKKHSDSPPHSVGVGVIIKF